MTKNFDECSGAFFKSSASGLHIPTVTVTQTDAKRAPVLIVQLANAVVTSFSESSAGGSPTQTITLSYGRITITNPTNGSKSCYDLLQNKTC